MNATTMSPFCSVCGRIHCAGDARAVGRFNPQGIDGYKIAESNSTKLYRTRPIAISAKCAMVAAANVTPTS